MESGIIEELRSAYHRRICEEVLRKNSDGVPNNADSSSNPSKRIGKGIIDHFVWPIRTGRLPGQTAGSRFEEANQGLSV